MTWKTKQTLMLLCLTLTLQPGHVKRVIDGDTFILFHVGTPPEERVRLLGVDTPEKNQLGFEEAKALTKTWLAKGPSTLTTCQRDSFGRYVATVERDGETLADALIQAGHSKKE